MEVVQIDKPFYKSWTVWGAIAIFAAGGLEALGATGMLDYVQGILGVLGIPVTVIGIRKAL